MLVDLQDRRITYGHKCPSLSLVCDQKAIDRAFDNWILKKSRKTEFDNFNEFIRGNTELVPTKLHFRVYEDVGLMIAYGKSFHAGKIRLQYLEARNNKLYDQGLVFSVTLFIMSLVLISFTSVITMRRLIINPIMSIHDGLRKIRGGNLNLQLNIAAGDEFGDLSEYFNETVNELKKSRSGMQQLLHNHAQSEEALRESEKQLRLITDNLPALIAYVDSNLRYRFSNKAYREFHGLSADTLTGNYVGDILSREAYKKIKSSLGAALSGTMLTFETQVTDKDGESHYLSSSYVPDLAGNGEVNGVYILANEITERKLVAEKEHQHMLELAHVSRLSTMGSMATEIAHELNQPLTSLASYADTLSRLKISGSWESEDVDDALHEIVKQVHRAADILQQLRKFIQKKIPDKSNVDINELVRGVIQLADVETRWNDIDIHHDLYQSLPRVWADRILIEQVILNLLRNAIEAMSSEKSLERSLMVKSQMTEKGEVEIGVSDTGPGFSREMQENIFKPFYTTKLDGMGMGLSISRSIVEAHGGKMWVISKPGKGAEIIFTLPVKE